MPPSLADTHQQHCGPMALLQIALISFVSAFEHCLSCLLYRNQTVKVWGSDLAQQGLAHDEDAEELKRKK